MIFKKLKIPDLIEIKPNVIKDSRGYFYESFKLSSFEKNIGKYPFVQENESYSKQNTLRGMHIQLKNTQGKLIRVLEGKIYDVCLDLRKKSHTYGSHCALILDEKNKKILWIPPGFAHGFLVLSPAAKVVYSCTDYYNSKSQISINPFDKYLKIKWPNIQNINISISSKDKNGLNFIDYNNKFSKKLKV